MPGVTIQWCAHSDPPKYVIQLRIIINTTAMPLQRPLRNHILTPVSCKMRVYKKLPLVLYGMGYFLARRSQWWKSITKQKIKVRRGDWGLNVCSNDGESAHHFYLWPTSRAAEITNSSSPCPSQMLGNNDGLGDGATCAENSPREHLVSWKHKMLKYLAAVSAQSLLLGALLGQHHTDLVGHRVLLWNSKANEDDLYIRDWPNQTRSHNHFRDIISNLQQLLAQNKALCIKPV